MKQGLGQAGLAGAGRTDQGNGTDRADAGGWRGAGIGVHLFAPFFCEGATGAKGKERAGGGPVPVLRRTRKKPCPMLGPPGMSRKQISHACQRAHRVPAGSSI
jgi:hypothetical protein